MADYVDDWAMMPQDDAKSNGRRTVDVYAALLDEVFVLS